MNVILYNPLKFDDIFITKMYLLIGSRDSMFLWPRLERDFYDPFRR